MSNQKPKKQKYIIYIMVCSILCITILALSWFHIEYFEGEYWDSAPDGVYLVNVTGWQNKKDNETYNTIMFPICPMREGTNTQLHGVWNTTVSCTQTEWKDYSGFYYARLKNNIIVELRRRNDK